MIIPASVVSRRLVSRTSTVTQSLSAHLNVSWRTTRIAALHAWGQGNYVLRGTAVIGVVMLAYGYSLLTLATSSPYLLLLPSMALLLGIERAVSTRSGPDIHDRYLDWIVGLPLLVAALVILVIVPISLSAYFWLWRLDLVSLPLFIAAAIDLTFGFRALWRLRAPIALVGLMWPANYVLNFTIQGIALADAIAKLPSLAGAALPRAQTVGVLISLVLLQLTPAAALVVSRLTARQRAIKALGFGSGARLRDLGQRVTKRLLSPVPARHLAVQRARTALVTLLVAGTLAGLANQALGQFRLVASPLGKPILQSAAVPDHPLPGWSVSKTDSFAWVPVYLGRGATWDRYEYSSDRSQDPGPPSFGLNGRVTLDLFTTADRGALASYGIEDSYRLHSYRLQTAQVIDLGGGVVARSVIYQQHSTGASWAGVYWEWPVQTSEGIAYQRVVLNVRNRSDAELRVAPSPGDRLQSLRGAALQVFGGARVQAATGTKSDTADALAEFGKRVGRASMRSS